MEMFNMMIEIWNTFIPKVSMNNKASLVWAMAWHHTGDITLPETMMIKVLDAKWHHLATVS